MRPRRRFPIALLSGVLAVALVVVGFWQFWLRRPIGAGPVPLPVAREGFSQVWTTRPVLLVGLGDSVTAGFGASPGLAYFDRLVTNPPGDFAEMQGLCLQAVLPNLRATNLAVSGSTSLQLARSQWPRLTRQPTNVLGLVVMTTGGNDLIHNYGRTPPVAHAMYGATMKQAEPWIRQFKQRMNSIVQRTRQRFPGGCEIFLADIYDPTDGVGDIENSGLPLPAWPDGLKVLAAYNRLLREAPGVHPVDLHGTFMGHGIHHREDYWYYANLEDPNDRGYEAIRQAFMARMRTALAR